MNSYPLPYVHTFTPIAYRHTTSWLLNGQSVTITSCPTASAPWSVSFVVSWPLYLFKCTRLKYHNKLTIDFFEGVVQVQPINYVMLHFTKIAQSHTGNNIFVISVHPSASNSVHAAEWRLSIMARYVHCICTVQPVWFLFFWLILSP